MDFGGLNGFSARGIAGFVLSKAEENLEGPEKVHHEYSIEVPKSFSVKLRISLPQAKTAFTIFP